MRKIHTNITKTYLKFALVGVLALSVASCTNRVSLEELSALPDEAFGPNPPIPINDTSDQVAELTNPQEQANPSLTSSHGVYGEEVVSEYPGVVLVPAAPVAVSTGKSDSEVATTSDDGPVEPAEPGTLTIASVELPQNEWDSTSTVEFPTQDEDDQLQSAVSSRNLSLRDAVDLALIRNPEIAMSRSLTRMAQSQIEQLQSAWYPSATYGVSPRMGTDGKALMTGNVGAEQLIYDFGRTSAGISGAKARKRKGEYELESARNRIAAKAAMAYLEVATANSLLQAAKRHQVKIRKVSKLIDARLSSGLADSSDSVQAKVGAKRSAAAVRKYDLARQSANSYLWAEIGVKANQVEELERLESVGKILLRKSRNLEAPTVQAAQEAIAIAEANVQKEKASRFPTIVGEANHSRSIAEGGNDGDTWVGLTLQGRIPLSGEYENRLESARLDREAAELAAKNAELTLTIGNNTFALEYQGALERAAAAQELRELAQTTADLYWSEYTLNKRTLSDVFSANSEVFNADAEVIQARSDAVRAVLSSAANSGTLVESLQSRMATSGNLK